MIPPKTFPETCDAIGCSCEAVGRSGVLVFCLWHAPVPYRRSEYIWHSDRPTVAASQWWRSHFGTDL